MTIVDVLMRGAKQEVQHVINFATTPTGPFTTVDQMVTTARQTVRSAGAEAGVGVSGRVGGYRGQLGSRVTSMRGRFPRARRY